MSVAVDTTDPKFAQYAHPDRLVSTQWLADHLGTEGLVVVESDEDVLLYETGHIPGAVKIDWHLDLNDPLVRDYIDAAAFAQLLGAKGIRPDTTVVIYGDRANWWAAYALWVFTLFGHRDVRLLDGGRDKWIAEGRELTIAASTPEPVPYPVRERDDATIRAFQHQVLAELRSPAPPALIDIRSPQEYTGERLHMPDYPEEGALRGGHIPTARNVPWARSVGPDGSFKPRAELAAIYQGDPGAGDDAGAEAGLGLDPNAPVITYCRIGERSSHTWFVLTHLLGFADVRNYDGSWTEWGNAVQVPIVAGEQPGVLPGR